MGELIEIQATVVIVPGELSGVAAVAAEPLSFWGGLDPTTGEIIDRRHPLSGQTVAGRVLVIPHGRGSCSASGVFLESIRNGFAPAAVITSRIDPIIGLGSILGDELYERPIPILVVDESERNRINSGDTVTIQLDGRISVHSKPSGPMQ